jgi:hypothetical protein
MDRAIIIVALFCSLLLLGLLGAGLNDAVLERVQEQRLQGVIGGLRTLLETDLRIGLPLPHDEPAQSLLEDAVTRTPMLDSIEIDSDGSVVLFDSDRALRGEPVPAAWREAARASPEGWRVVRRDEHSVGTPLRDAFGQPAGYLVWTHHEPHDGIAWSLLVKLLGIAACAAGIALLVDWITERLSRARRGADLRLLQAGNVAGGGEVGEVLGVLAEARDELVRVDREARRIAGIAPGILS